MTGGTYIKVSYVVKAADEKTLPTTKDGYHTCKNNDAVVWVKAGAPATTYLLTVRGGTGGGSFGDANSTSTTFSMPSGNVTVTANWSYNGGGSSAPVKPTEPVSGSTNLTAVTDAQGTATAGVTAQNLSDAIRAAKEEAAKKEVNPGDTTVVLNLTTGQKGATSVRVNLPKTLQDSIINPKIANTVIVVDQLSIGISLDLTAMTEVRQRAGADVNLTAVRTDGMALSAEAKSIIGNRPAFNLMVNYGDGHTVQDFGKGRGGIGIPYTPRSYEQTGNLHAIYADKDGKVQWRNDSLWALGKGRYRLRGGLWTAKRHIGHHRCPGRLYAPWDVRDGTGAAGGYRQHKIQELQVHRCDGHRLLCPCAAWAAEKGITSGTAAATFSPDKAISRQEMAVMIGNYTKAMNYTLPKTREVITFTDSADIASWAKDAVGAMQMAGVLNGKDGSRFDATATAARAEVSAMLHRYVELVIDPQTAQGPTRTTAAVT